MMSEKNNIILTPNPTLSSLCGPQCKTGRLSIVEEILDCGLLFTAMRPFSWPQFTQVYGEEVGQGDF